MSKQIGRLVPWTGGGEWNFVYQSIMTRNEKDLKTALSIMQVWCTRGNIPPAIESTMNILKIKLAHSTGQVSCIRLAMACALIRFVNEVVDPNQKGTHALPVSQLAEKMNSKDSCGYTTLSHT